MGDSVAEKIAVPIARISGGPKAEEHTRAYYEDMGKHDFGAAAKEALMSNLEIARHWMQGIERAAKAVSHAVSSVTHHDKPLDTPPPPKDAPVKRK